MVIAMPISLFGQGLGLPDPDILEQELRNDGLISNELPPYDPADYAQPELGKVRQYERKQVLRVKGVLANYVASADPTKNWINNANTLIQKLTLFEASGLRSDLLDSINPLLGAFSNLADSQVIEDSVEHEYLDSLEELAQLIHGEIYRLIKENEGTLTNKEWVWISKMSLYRTLWQMGYWENKSEYILSAGAFILDANMATTELKTKTLEETEIFLGGHTDVSFFERYEAAGDGMDILKTKYAANKAAIQAKFAEVLAHVAQLENQ